MSGFAIYRYTNTNIGQPPKNALTDATKNLKLMFGLYKPCEMANNKFKEFFQLGEVGNYFFRVFGKPDPTQKTNFNLRMMHGINKISILVFIAAMVIWIFRRLM